MNADTSAGTIATPGVGTAELVIVGAGPAGVSGALWARTLSIRTHVIERAPEVGGQLRLIRFHPLELPGIRDGDGATIAETCARQLADAGIAPDHGVEALGLEATASGVIVHTARGRIEAKAVLVATGSSRRTLGVPGERELSGAGVSYSGRQDRERLAGHDVIVVGGGDGAYENALLLSEAGCHVLLVMRDRPRARPEFQARVASDPRIEVMTHTRVVEILGQTRVDGVRLEHRGAIVTRPARGVVIKIGMVPNTGWCAGLARDADGYLVVDARGRTSRERVWAAGDVARPLLPSFAAAIGSGTTALADIRATLRGA